MPFHSSDSGESRPDATDSVCCCAFLCDDDGQVLHDFGDQPPLSNRSISAHSLSGLIESQRLMDFLATVRNRGTTLGWEPGIRAGESAGRLLLHGAPTPCGILVFATVTRDAPTDSGMAAGSLMGREASGGHPEAANQRRRSGSDDEDPNVLLTAAHDLKNPISSILSSCEYLVSYGNENLEPVQLEMIAGIELSAKTLLQLSGRVYELSRVKWRLAERACKAAKDESI